jgi:hypothetical protein
MMERNRKEKVEGRKWKKLKKRVSNIEQGTAE